MAQRNSNNSDEHKPLYRTNQRTFQANGVQLRGTKSGRVHHLVGTAEIYSFFCYDWSPKVLDIFDQYALEPIEETLDIANDLGLKHPTAPKSKKPRKIATTFKLDVARDMGSVPVARSVRSVKKLVSPTCLEELEIERRYWQTRSVDWGVTTDADLTKPISSNIDFLLDHMDISKKVSVPQAVVAAVQETLMEVVARNQGSIVNDIVSECQSAIDVHEPTSLLVIYHLLAHRKLKTDLTEMIKPYSSRVFLALP